MSQQKAAKPSNKIEYFNDTTDTYNPGDVIVFGNQVTVACSYIKPNRKGIVYVEGIFENMPAVSDTAFAVGDSLYWNEDDEQLTTDSADVPAGICAAPKAEADTTATLRLQPLGGAGASGGGDMLADGSVPMTDTLSIVKSASAGEGGMLFLKNSATSTTGSTAGIVFATESGSTVDGVREAEILAINENGAYGATGLSFRTWDGGTSAERLRIQASGVTDWKSHDMTNVQNIYGPHSGLGLCGESGDSNLYLDNNVIEVYANEAVTFFTSGIVLPKLSADPSTPVNGTVYYNTATDKMRLYAGGAWVDLN